jgi:hypothetical protein
MGRSRQPVRVSDIRRGAMIAGQILEKLFALTTAAAPSGDCAEHDANGFAPARAQRSERKSRAEGWRLDNRNITSGHDALQKDHERNVVIS